ncbi:MAG: hypothetical protein ABL911_06925 [Gallionella sp.]
MIKVFNFYADPGHGWMAVKKQQLVELGIAAKITPCSYQRGETAYLEEDGDLDLFFEAFLKKTGEKPVLKHHHSDRRSKIRNYDSYRCDSAIYRVVATVHNPRTNEDVNPAMVWNTDSGEAAIRQAEYWTRNGFWSAVYDSASGEALKDFTPARSLQ